MCDVGVYSREIIKMCFVGQASGLFEKFSIWIYADTINVINVKLCMVLLLIKLYMLYYFKLHWPYYKVTAMFNSFKLKILCPYPA